MKCLFFLKRVIKAAKLWALLFLSGSEYRVDYVSVSLTENFGCRRQVVGPRWVTSSVTYKEVLASKGKTQALGSWRGSAKTGLKTQRQSEMLLKDWTHCVWDRANLPLWFTRNRVHVLSKRLHSRLTSCREIWACSSWMLLVATGLSSISLWAPSMSSWRCCISCSYCSYCTTASFERKKKHPHDYLSVTVTMGLILCGRLQC